MPRSIRGGNCGTGSDRKRAIGSVLYPAVAIAAPGLIDVYTHKSGNRMPIGEPDGSRSARILALHEALVGAGFKAPVRPDIRTDIWVKLWGNLTFNPLSALTGSTLGDFLADPDCRAVAEAMMREGETVANALGVSIPISMAKRIAGAEGIGAFKTSMLQDLESGRPMELDALVGAVAELGRLTNTADAVDRHGLRARTPARHRGRLLPRVSGLERPLRAFLRQ